MQYVKLSEKWSLLFCCRKKSFWDTRGKEKLIYLRKKNWNTKKVLPASSFFLTKVWKLFFTYKNVHAIPNVFTLLCLENSLKGQHCNWPYKWMSAAMLLRKSNSWNQRNYSDWCNGQEDWGIFLSNIFKTNLSWSSIWLHAQC